MGQSQQPSLAKKIRERCLLIVWMLIVAAFGSWLAVMAADNQVPYDYLSGEISPNPARAGSRVTLKWYIKTHRICPVSIRRLLTDVNGKVVAVFDPLPYSQTVEMGDKELPKTFLLPDSLPAQVTYNALACFKCNALQALFPLCVDTPRITFNVRQD